MKLNQDGIWNIETVCNASGIFHSVTTFQFIVCLTVVSRCLEATRPLNKQLQSSTFDVVAANEKGALLYKALQRMRLQRSYCHEQWHSEATSFAQSVNFDPSRPRTVHRQINRANTPAESISEYYERILTLPFLDHLTFQVQTRFSDRKDGSLEWVLCLSR